MKILLFVFLAVVTSSSAFAYPYKYFCRPSSSSNARLGAETIYILDEKSVTDAYSVNDAYKEGELLVWVATHYGESLLGENGESIKVANFIYVDEADASFKYPLTMMVDGIEKAYATYDGGWQYRCIRKPFSKSELRKLEAALPGAYTPKGRNGRVPFVLRK